MLSFFVFSKQFGRQTQSVHAGDYIWKGIKSFLGFFKSWFWERLSFCWRTCSTIASTRVRQGWTVHRKSVLCFEALHIDMSDGKQDEICQYHNVFQQHSLLIRRFTVNFKTASKLQKNTIDHPPRTRQSLTNAATYCLTLDYNQVRLIMPLPPFEGGGGNHYTSCIHRSESHRWSLSWVSCHK